MSKILFITHREKQCGVFEFGNDVFNAISSSAEYEFIKVECESLSDLHTAIAAHSPRVIIYNYHPVVMPWLCKKVSKGIYRNNIASINILQIGIIHEITQQVADTATAYRNKYILGSSEIKLNSLFDFYIAADPTLLLKNPLVFKTGRLVPEYNKDGIEPPVTTIGSFGFATPKKGFEKIVELVQQEFDEAVIKLNMPSADFGDKDGSNARKIAARCQAIITKSDITLQISYDFLNKEQLLDFLAGNSINVFLYEDSAGRGISSAVDNALAVKKPIAVSGSPMFRHILTASPSVCAENMSLKTIFKNGFEPLKRVAKDWNKENMVWEFERILNRVLSNKIVTGKMGFIRTIQSKFNRLFTVPDKSFTWLRNTNAASDDDFAVSNKFSYSPVPGPLNFNRILDDAARLIYQPAVDKLFELVPKTMSKKIGRANVQQGFVFDTVYRYLDQYQNPKVLCVGSYEDTASMGLKRLGYVVDEIDPMINYYLQEYYTKPSVKKDSYDIIFSTSVIEHDPDDKTFIECIEGLLAPNGVAVITCDYKDGWKPGEPKPEVDARFYTRHDLEQRLLSYLPGCELVDKPNWECPNPDFNYLGKYQYTFATFVVRKKS